VPAGASESIDDVLRRMVAGLAHLVATELDPSARVSRAVTLAADNAEWQPAVASLQASVELHVGPWLARVEVHRRRRSDEVPTAPA
jgi:hypothetical protein